MAFFTAEQIEAFKGQSPRFDFLVKLEFVSDTAYLWNGHYELTTGGNTYLPLHGIGRIEGLGMTSGAQSQAVTLQISGLPDQSTNLLALALEQTPEANQQLATISLQLFDADWQPVGNPVPVFFGFMQPPKVERAAATKLEGAQQTITITAENALYNRSRPPQGRFSDRDQQTRYPGDKAFQFVSSLQFKTFTYPDY